MATKLLNNLSYEDLEALHTAMIKDCDAIVEAFKDEIDIHTLNARHMKQTLTEVYDAETESCVCSDVIKDWMRTHILNNFYFSDDGDTRFVFPYTKNAWLRITIHS